MLKRIAIVTGLVVSLTSAQADIRDEYTGSTFNDVWKQVISDPYENPNYDISFSSLSKWFENKIKESAERTLSDRSDILPEFRKLAHPNGICLAGTWNITESNPFGGYFQKGSEALIIARASTAMSGTKKGEYRAMGLAGKVFPTLNETETVKPASFFLVDDLGGTKAAHWTDVELTNEPKVSKTVEIVKNLFYALKLAATFGKADSNPGMRQVYEISELGVDNVKKVKTPKWMMIKTAPGQTVNKADFRDELNLDNRGGKLILEIHVAAADKKFKKIGNILFTESVVSNSCDRRLHFPHPKWRSDLIH